MRLLILGANGRTGREVVAQALRAGHHVTAFVRRTDGLPASAPALSTVIGDVVRDEGAVAAALHGTDAVVSTLGNGLLPDQRPGAVPPHHAAHARARGVRAACRRHLVPLASGCAAARTRCNGSSTPRTV